MFNRPPLFSSSQKVHQGAAKKPAGTAGPLWAGAPRARPDGQARPSPKPREGAGGGGGSAGAGARTPLRGWGEGDPGQPQPVSPGRRFSMSSFANVRGLTGFNSGPAADVNDTLPARKRGALARLLQPAVFACLSCPQCKPSPPLSGAAPALRGPAQSCPWSRRWRRLLPAQPAITLAAAALGNITSGASGNQ